MHVWHGLILLQLVIHKSSKPQLCRSYERYRQTVNNSPFSSTVHLQRWPTMASYLTLLIFNKGYIQDMVLTSANNNILSYICMTASCKLSFTASWVAKK